MKQLIRVVILFVVVIALVIVAYFLNIHKSQNRVAFHQKLVDQFCECKFNTACIQTVAKKLIADEKFIGLIDNPEDVAKLKLIKEQYNNCANKLPENLRPKLTPTENQS